MKFRWKGLYCFKELTLHKRVYSLCPDLYQTPVFQISEENHWAKITQFDLQNLWKPKNYLVALDPYFFTGFNIP